MLITMNVKARESGNVLLHDIPRTDSLKSLEISFSTPESTVLLAVQGTKEHLLGLFKEAIDAILDDGQQLTPEQLENERQWELGWGKL